MVIIIIIIVIVYTNIHKPKGILYFGAIDNERCGQLHVFVRSSAKRE